MVQVWQEVEVTLTKLRLHNVPRGAHAPLTPGILDMPNLVNSLTTTIVVKESSMQLGKGNSNPAEQLVPATQPEPTTSKLLYSVAERAKMAGTGESCCRPAL